MIRLAGHLHILSIISLILIKTIVEKDDKMLNQDSRVSVTIKIEHRDHHFYTVISSHGLILRSECFNTKAAATMASEMFIKQYRP